MTKFSEIFLGIGIEKDGREGVVTITKLGNNDVNCPLICTAQHDKQYMLDIAQTIANRNEKTIQILRFTQREVIAEFFPEESIKR